MKKATGVVLTCEHAGNRVPPDYRFLFEGKSSVLLTHRGFDIGVFQIARRIANILQQKLFACQTSRLLIEVNRSIRHPDLFSEFSRVLPDSEKDLLVQSVYDRYRKSVIRHIEELIWKDRNVLHLSLHSFAPLLQGKRRNADIGILYDPAYVAEKAFSTDFQKILRSTTGLRIRRNYPYLGSADGFTTTLRRNFAPTCYRGIEIEFNQELLAKKGTQAYRLAEGFCRSLEQALRVS